MLSAMRRNSRHAIIYVLFGILIAAFVISFGPGSRGFGYQGVTSAYAVKVAGATVSEQEFHAAYVARGWSGAGERARELRLKEMLMDEMIKRELLAEEADKLGFNVSTKEADDNIVEGHTLVAGAPAGLNPYVFKDGHFDYERFRMVTQNTMGLTVRHFVEQQQRELLADKVRQLMRSAVKVSPDEVKQQYMERGLQVNLEFAKYPERRYADQVAEPTPAEVDAYVKAHEADLKKQYDDRSFLYKNLERQAKLRHIVLEVAKDAPQKDVDAAKAKADAAMVKLKAGILFATLASNVSTDTRTKVRGGELGFLKKGMTGFGDAVDDKIFKAKPGDLIGPERTARGWEIIQVEQFREGDVPLAEAEREMATEEVRKQKAMDKAKAEAQAVIDRVHKGEKLEAVVPKEAPSENESPQDKKLKALTAGLGGEPVKLQETGLFSRRGDMVQDIGISKELSKKAFELKPGEVAGPFDVGTGWVVVRVKEHHDPDMADFEKRKSEIVRRAELEKSERIVDSWAHQRCIEARDDGRIKVNPEALEYEGIGKSLTKYEPCAARANLFGL